MLEEGSLNVQEEEGTVLEGGGRGSLEIYAGRSERQ